MLCSPQVRSRMSSRRWSSLALAGLLTVAGTMAPTSASAQPPADLQLMEVTSIANSAPVAIRHAGDGTNRLFIVQQSGIIWIYDINSDTLLNTPFLDIQNLVESGGEQGLLGLAFHPNFSSNGFFYVNYTRDPGPGLDRTAVVRFTASGNTANAASALTLIEIAQDFGNHNGGDIHFGADGYLYIGMGDGGSGGDPNNRAQDMSQLLGKMLRIDVNGASEGFAPTPDPARSLGLNSADSEAAQKGVINNCGLVGNYDVPNDNPFINDDNACDEIWASGLRNPWRFSFDRLTNDMLIADVGQSAREEVDFQPASSTGGEDYGWNCREGNVPFGSCTDPNFVDPVIDYNHGGGRCSITGGFVYRGSIPSLNGFYAYADICSQELWFASQADSWTPILWSSSAGTIYSFGEDEAGELYVALAGGSIRKFVSAESNQIFDDGFETGDTTVWSSAIP